MQVPRQPSLRTVLFSHVHVRALPNVSILAKDRNSAWRANSNFRVPAGAGGSSPRRYKVVVHVITPLRGTEDGSGPQGGAEVENSATDSSPDYAPDSAPDSSPHSELDGDPGSPPSTEVPSTDGQVEDENGAAPEQAIVAESIERVEDEDGAASEPGSYPDTELPSTQGDRERDPGTELPYAERGGVGNEDGDSPASASASAGESSGSVEDEVLDPAMKELNMLQEALHNASKKLELMEEQVTIVKALQLQFSEQQALIITLNKALGARWKDSRTSPAEELKAILKQQIQLTQDLMSAGEGEEADLMRLQEQLASNEVAHKQMEMLVQEVRIRVQVAEDAAAQATTGLQEANSALAKHEQMKKDLEEEKELVQRLGSSATTSSSSSAPTPSLSNPFGSLRGKGRGKGGKKGADAKGVMVALSQTKDEIKLLGLTMKRRAVYLESIQEELGLLREKELEKTAQMGSAMEAMETTKKKLMGQLESLQASHDEEQRVIAELQEQVSEVVALKEGSVKEAMELKSQIDALNDEIKKSREDGEALMEKLDGAALVERERKEVMARLEAELQDFIEQVRQTHQRFEALTASLAEKDEQKLILLEDLEVLREKELHTQTGLKGAQEGLTRLQEILGDRNMANHEVQKKIEVLEMEAAELRRTTKDAQAKMDEAEGHLAKLSSHVMAVKTELANKRQAVDDCAKRLLTLQEAEAPCEERRRELEVELEEKRRVFDALLSTETKELESLKLSNSELTTKIADMQRERSSLMQLLVQLEEMREVFNGLGLDMKLQPEELRKSVVTVVQENREMVDKLGELIKKVELLQDQEQERVSEMQAAKEKTQSLSSEIVRLQNEIQLYLDAMASSKAEIAAVDLSAKESEIAEACEAKLQALQEARGLELQISELTQELVLARQDGYSKGLIESSAKPYGRNIDNEIGQLVAVMQDELLSTKALLSKVEALVKSSRSEASPEAGSSVMLVEFDVEERMKTLLEAQDRALRAQIEAGGLREHIHLLEESCSKLEVLYSHMGDALRVGGDSATRILTSKLSEISDENEVLKMKYVKSSRSMDKVQKFMTTHVVLE